MPCTVPLLSNRTLVPTSTADVSLASASAGVAKSSQIVHGHAAGRGLPVVNDQVYGGLGIELPALSVARTDAVYVVPDASGWLGVNVADLLSGASAYVPAIGPVGLLRLNCNDDGATASSKVIFGGTVNPTLPPLLTGLVDATSGARVSGPGS